MTLQVGVKALLFNAEGKLLLLKRSGKYPGVQGVWDIPGGRIEAGSALRENLAREIREETGLALEGTPLLIAAQDILREDKHVVRLTYRAQASGEPMLDAEENTEYAWLSLEELRDFPDLDVYVQELLDEGKIVI